MTEETKTETTEGRYKGPFGVVRFQLDNAAEAEAAGDGPREAASLRLAIDHLVHAVETFYQPLSTPVPIVAPSVEA